MLKATCRKDALLRDDSREPDDGKNFDAPDAGFPLSTGFITRN
jgi:hypothetical protein